MLLRYPDATSTLEAMEKGGFCEVLDDTGVDVNHVDTVVLCSGKFYYEMKVKAKELGVQNMAFVRVEQLYPLPEKQINEIIGKYSPTQVIWAQEEPANMGAWTYMAMNLRALNLVGIHRGASAAPAEGSKKLHEKRLSNLYDSLFAYAKLTVEK
jgi:2-oxoglutarate dehydrogenase E1 component